MGPARTPTLAVVTAAAVALIVAGYGGPQTPSIDPGTDPGTALAPPCEELEPLRAGTTEHHGGADAVGGEGLQRWAEREASDAFAGLWLDGDGWVMAFTDDADAHGREAGGHVGHPVAVVEAEHTLAELHEVQRSIDEGELGVPAAAEDHRSGPEPGAVVSTGVQVMVNRVAVGVYAPGEERLAELGERYGTERICVEVTPQPGGDDAAAAPFVPAADPGPDDAEIDLLVNEWGCAGGTTAEDRIVEPEVEVRDDAVVVTVRIVPPPGPQTCPSNPDTPYTLVLDEPLGDRRLLDGSRTPPAPPERDW